MRSVGKTLGFPKKRIVGVLPEPWVFDQDSRPSEFNRWRIETLSGGCVTVKHVRTRKRLKLLRQSVRGTDGKNLLLTVQVALYMGIIQLLPLPPGYWT